MSLVIAHVGWDFVTVGADRGAWTCGADGLPTSKPFIASRSKIHAVPGVPVVIATVGADHGQWIAEWIAAHPLDPQGYSLPDYAKAFVRDFYAYHNPIADKKLAECGLTLPDRLEPGTREYSATAAQVIVAGLQPGWQRAQIWSAQYPGDNLSPGHYSIEIDGEGNAYRAERASIYAMGQHGPLQPFIGAIGSVMDAARSQAIVTAMLDVREKLGRDEVPVPVLGPFDVVRVTSRGVEWLAGCEGSAEGSAQREGAFAFDSAGNAQASTMMLQNIPNTISNMLADVSLQWASPSSGSLNIWITNGGATGLPTWTPPNGGAAIAPSSAACGSSGTPLHSFTGLNAATKYYFIIYYSVASGLFQNYTTAYSSAPTNAQIAAALADGTILAVVATASTTSGITPSGGGITGGISGGTTGHSRYA